MLSLFTLTLWTKHMVKMYEMLFSVFLIVVSYRCNQQASNTLALTSISPLKSLLKLDLVAIYDSIPSMFYVVWNIGSQSVLASGYLLVNSRPAIPTLQGLLALSFIVPSFTVMLPLANNPLPLCGCLIVSIHAACVLMYKFPSVTESFPLFNWDWCDVIFGRMIGVQGR